MAATSEISLLTFDEFADTTDRVFNKWPELVQDLADVQSLYMTENIPGGTGDRRVYQEVDGETYAHYKAEGADAGKSLVVMGYSKTMYAKRYACEIDITYEARNYGKNQEIIRKLTSLATFCPQRMALDLTHRLTFATSTSYTDMDGETITTTVGDGNAVVDATHDLTGSTTTYTNIITSNPVFTQGAFEVARGLANTQIYSNMGERRIMNFNTVVTGDDPATVRAVKQLLNSTADVTQNNPGVTNQYKSMFRHVMLPRLATTATGAYDSTKAKYWAYVAAGEWEAHLGIWEAPHLISPSAGSNAEDIHNDNWVFGARVGYGIVILSGKGFLLSTAAGS